MTLFLDAYNLLITVYMVVLQVLDLHTTSEVLKHNAGVERNEKLAFLNALGPHADKFWKLVTYKILASAMSVGIYIITLYVPEQSALAAILQTIMAIYYSHIIASNIAIYRTIKQPS